MHIFTDYLQPLTTWLYANPHWALAITFLIALSESLAIIGSIIPGSVTMTAIGILAGSGVMRIDLTLLAATLGAIVGDGISYALGYTFRNSLVNVWPFSRYPTWLSYGKDYFARHGGKSVLLGRFIGPLRSIIPVIAGMLHMNHWHFFIANVLSAIGWSILYVMPGVLIGAASTELSVETASRLFVLIIILLVLLWVATIGIKWLLKHLNLLLRINLHRFWLWSKEHPRLAYYFKLITPAHESNHYPTAVLIITLLFGFTASIMVTLFVLQGTYAAKINYPIYLLLQSLHTNAFDVFFILIGLFIKPLALTALMLSIVFYALYYHDWRILRYWLSLALFCTTTVLLLAYFVHVPENVALLRHNINLFYPAIELTFATTFFSFLIFYISTRYRTAITLAIRVILLLLLLLSGIGSIYLGDNWFTSVLGAYCIGLTISIAHWIFYRQVNQLESRSQLPIVFSCLVLAIATTLSSSLYLKKLIHVHRSNLTQYVLTDTTWWDQQQSLLPLYANNRLGQPTGLLNIQYAGSIETIQQALTAYGWKEQPASFFYSLLMRASGKDSAEDLPLTAQLYHNKKPSLYMTYYPGQGELLLVLRLWRSNYHLRDNHQPIWLGSVQPYSESREVQSERGNRITDKSLKPFKHIVPALYGFKFNRIPLQHEILKPLPQAIAPTLLLIKEPSEN